MCSWQCGGCGVWYPYSVSSCECSKLLHIETTGGTQPTDVQQLKAEIAAKKKSDVPYGSDYEQGCVSGYNDAIDDVLR